ncbi:MAG: type II toxin-antitoxin system PemK/MazF family toxin [Cyanobacteriota bacterium]|nr:type II toxin-antitoxin system PemK/MazF family toxin [Cyanobacteriota bacterium]
MDMVTDEAASRGDIYLVSLNSTRGAEIRKTRPCVVISPDELNAHLRTFVVAPLTTGGHPYPFRVRCHFEDQFGYVVVDQLRAVNRERLIKRLGVLPGDTLVQVLSILQAMFAV